jgi:hypothetical protein
MSRPVKKIAALVGHESFVDDCVNDIHLAKRWLARRAYRKGLRHCGKGEATGNELLLFGNDSNLPERAQA